MFQKGALGRRRELIGGELLFGFRREERLVSFSCEIALVRAFPLTKNLRTDSLAGVT